VKTTIFPCLHNTKLHRKIQQADVKCLEFMKRKYAVTTVFVTFETERDQRLVLEKLTVAKISIATNDTSVLEPSYCFRGDLVLDVEEAKEPSVIRWPDLNETLLARVLQRIFTGAITVTLIALGFFAVKRAFHFNLTLAAVLIAVLNIVIPNIFKLVNRIESHAREGSYQASLYAKISFFLFFNTAIVTTMIKPFTMTIADEKAALIPTVYAVLKAEIVTAPIVHMLDIVGQIKRLAFVQERQIRPV
jgi:hypothetical protein